MGFWTSDPRGRQHEDRVTACSADRLAWRGTIRARSAAAPHRTPPRRCRPRAGPVRAEPPCDLLKMRRRGNVSGARRAERHRPRRTPGRSGRLAADTLPLRCGPPGSLPAVHPSQTESASGVKSHFERTGTVSSSPADRAAPWLWIGEDDEQVSGTCFAVASDTARSEGVVACGGRGVINRRQTAAAVRP
jgi:hypothetical protein